MAEAREAGEQSEIEQATVWLEKLTGDPMADAVRGRVTIVAVSQPAPRPRYQECRVEMIAEAPGIPSTPVVQEVVFSTKRWPRAGVVLPARVSAADPRACEVVWDALPALSARRR